MHTDIKDHIAKATDEMFKAALLTNNIYNKMSNNKERKIVDSDYDDVENSNYDSVSVPKDTGYNNNQDVDGYDYDY